MDFIDVLPADIEKRSFEIITEELGDTALPCGAGDVVKRVIHTTADFDYAKNLCFSDGAVQAAMDAIKSGASVVTDTMMARAGINERVLSKFGGEVYCFMRDADVAVRALELGTTRAAACMEKAAGIGAPLIFAIGNAPTALIALDRLIRQGKISPKLIIGTPVGFVNVVQAKELIMGSGAPYIVARGRKGGSNVAAAICNAILYRI